MKRIAMLLGLLALMGCSMQDAPLTQADYDGETIDYGVPPTSVIRTGNQGYEAPTPVELEGAKRITTPELRALLVSEHPPILIDVLGGNQTVSLPGAVWLGNAGFGSTLTDNVQARLRTKLAALTNGDKARPLAFFCLSKTCWLSHNAAVRAVSMGYTQVYWYRGGRNAWRAAGLSMPAVTAASW